MARAFSGAIGQDLASSNTLYNYIQGTSAISISAWCKCGIPSPNPQSIVRLQGSAGSYVVLVWNGGTTNDKCIISADGGVSTPTSWPSGLRDGNWHHLCLSWRQNATFAIYYDGALQDSRAAANATLDVSTGITPRLGSFQGASEFFNGSMSDIAIWNTALTLPEVRQLFSGMKPPPLIRPANLTFYWPLNEPSGTGVAVNYGAFPKLAFVQSVSTPTFAIDPPNVTVSRRKYPIAGLDLHTIGLFKPQVAAITAVFRKTLSPIGGRVGTRQIQGWAS